MKLWNSSADVWTLICPARMEPPVLFSLFIRPMCPRIFKKNVRIIGHSQNISVDILLAELIFIFADYLFLLWMHLKKLWDMYSTYFFSLALMQKDSDRHLQERRNASRVDMLILPSMMMRRGIGRCCENNLENGVIVFYVKSSFRMCMFHILACQCVWFRMWTKSLTLEYEATWVMLPVENRVLNLIQSSST